MEKSPSSSGDGGASQGKDEEQVSVFGTIQSWPRVKSTFASAFLNIGLDKDVLFIDGLSRTSFKSISKQAVDCDLRSRCQLHPKERKRDVVVVRMPSGTNGLIAILAALYSNAVIVPLSFERVTQTQDITRVLHTVDADVYVTTREGLWEMEYSLVRLRVKGASFGGEAQLVPGCVDLSCPMDPLVPRIANAPAVVHLDDPCMLFYDEHTKQCVEFTERSVMSILSSSTSSDSNIIVSSFNALTVLSEILPRLVYTDQACTIVFDPLHGTRIKRRIVRPGPQLADKPSLELAGPKDVTTLLLNAVGRGRICDGGPLAIRQQVITTDNQNMFLNQVMYNSVGRGRLVISGPAVFRQVVKDVSATVQSFFLDAQGRLWLDTGDNVQIEGKRVFLSPSSTLPTTPRQPRPVRRPIKTDKEEETLASRL